MTDSGLVSWNDACPVCEERRMDWLVWDEDGESVTCATCGNAYAPGKEPYHYEEHLD